MIHSVLQQFGLGESDVEVYLALIQQATIRPSVLAERLRRPRTTVQNVLQRLERKGLAVQVHDGTVQTFSAVHPENLSALLEIQKRETLANYKQAEQELDRIMPEILGIMHSAKSIPQIRFFRGQEGCRDVLFDTLTSPTELKGVTNIDAMFEVLRDIGLEYVAEREKGTVTKRSLVLDTEFARSIYEKAQLAPKTQKGYKWIPSELYSFSIEMNIYDGKVSYITCVREEIIGVIIENDHIFQMHESLWNMLWDLLPCP